MYIPKAEEGSPCGMNFARKNWIKKNGERGNTSREAAWKHSPLIVHASATQDGFGIQRTA